MTIYTDLKTKLEEIRKLAEGILDNSEYALKEVEDGGDGYISDISYFKRYLQKIFDDIGELDKLDTILRDLLENNQVVDKTGWATTINTLNETSDNQ